MHILSVSNSPEKTTHTDRGYKKQLQVQRLHRTWKTFLKQSSLSFRKGDFFHLLLWYPSSPKCVLSLKGGKSIHAALCIAYPMAIGSLQRLQMTESSILDVVVLIQYLECTFRWELRGPIPGECKVIGLMDGTLNKGMWNCNFFFLLFSASLMSDIK
ncbi:hypothetical protein TNCT_175811 [Trichonephila clavata]|uniref:Uncharacterized protein n=1 Tax=Trichonephila clavata TaxID=2740835 RepID=A0A8X6KNM5_TRICU|nr:hypothetical protein TNCT_366641 [Trichonephila clavata]GFR06474.1 hypothetical protein TNCT_175811 [Trichonephila clavata]